MEFFFGFLTFVEYLLFKILRGIYSFFSRSKPPAIPNAKNPLLQLSATTLAKQIRAGEITSQSVVEAYIDRIREVNPLLNAVIEDRFEDAINEAKECDAKLKAGEVTASLLEKEKPLYGIPVTIKESCALKGLSYTGCTIPRRGIKATEDALIVQSLKNAGAIPLCVTNTPELCSHFDSSNRLFGSTNNPYDRRFSAGGSSGGEGALIGAGASLIGVGSDLAGSIRIPALFNGIFGHKPTPDVTPLKGHYPMSECPVFQKYLVLGPMARYADDLHLAMKVMSAEHGQDLRLDEPVDIKKLRVFSADSVPSFLSIRTPTLEIRQCIQNATDYLVKSGALYQELPKHLFNDYFYAILATFLTEPKLPLQLGDPNDPKNPTCELLKSFAGLSEHTKGAIYTKLMSNVNAIISQSKRSRYRDIVHNLRQEFANLLKDDAVLIFPTFTIPTDFKNLLLLRMDNGMYCLTANLLYLPSTHVPMGLDKNGLPIGFQVIAGPKQDRLCLAVAREMEKKFGGWVAPGSK